MQNIVTTGVSILRIFDGASVQKKELPRLFCEEDLNIINSMYKEGTITDNKNEVGKVVVKLTTRGQLILFIEDNRSDVYSFGELLESMGIDTTYLYNYLEQYLNSEYIELYNIDNYKKYLKLQSDNISKRLLLNNRNI